MHPSIVRSEPGQCPICHMDLQLLEETAEGPPEASLPTHASFAISSQRQQLIGIARGEVRKRPLERVIRTSGRIAYDPELYSAIEEYRQARESLSGASSEDAKKIQGGMLRSSETRLRLLGLSEEQIRELAGRTGPPTELLLGPQGGKVWVYADIYQSEMGLARPGQGLEARTTAIAGRIFRGVVKAVDRVVNPVTRTVRVRALLDNPEGLLKPEMYLDVHIRVPLGSRLAVPEDAVLETGEQQLAFVLRGETIEPRLVTIGRRGEGFVEILQGLSEGETVVTSANFLIDSESRLRSAIAAFGGSAQPGHQH